MIRWLKKSSPNRCFAIKRVHDESHRRGADPLSGWESIRRSHFFAAILLAIATAGLYLPTLGAGFVWDGEATVVINEYVHNARHLFDVLTLRVMRMDVIDNNRPVHVASVILNWALWGANPAGHHFTSIVLHAFVTVLLFAFCRKLTRGASPWAAFLAALIFAVHPVNCEAVSEVSYSKDLVVAACVLGALNLTTVFRPEWTRRNVLLAAACVLLVFLAVGTKENGTVGAAVLGCYWLLFRRMEPRAGWLGLCGAAGLVVVLFLVARFTLPPKDSIIFASKPQYPGGSLAAALGIQPRIWVFYMRQIVWPQNLCADYGPYAVRNFGYGISLALLLAVAVAQVSAASVNRVFALGAAFFWLALLPVSNLVPIFRPMADRFLYLPMCGVAIMLASVSCGGTGLRRGAAAVAIVTAVAFSIITFQREKVWHDNIALWSDVAKKNPSIPESAVNLGSALFDAGRLEESLAEYQRAVKLNKGTDAETFAGMALPLDALGRAVEADEAFRKAVALNGRYAHPDLLVKGLMWNKKDAALLQVIVDRN
jgi:protein O-mannosyl-transferase